MPATTEVSVLLDVETKLKELLHAYAFNPNDVRATASRMTSLLADVMRARGRSESDVLSEIAGLLT